MQRLVHKHPLAIRRLHWRTHPVILMSAGPLLTGLAIYKPVSFGWFTTLLGGYEWARWVHFWLTMSLVAFFVVHVVQVVKAGWNNFRAMVIGYEVVPVDVRPPTDGPSRETGDAS